MLIDQTKECFDSLSSFRRKRNRCRDFTYGRQWNDIIEVDGRRLTEYEYIMSEGNVPLKNNLIRRIVRNVLGLFRERLPEIMAKEYASNLKGVAEANSLEEIYCRSMEEFLISGMVVHRKRLGYREGVAGVWTETVSPSCFFFNSDSRDTRGWDMNLIGQLHQVDFSDWCRAFVRTRNDYRHAKALFSDNRKSIRVTEVWRREMTPSLLVHETSQGRLIKKTGEEAEQPLSLEQKSLWRLDEIWKYYFLTEDGQVITSGISPYLHGSHPYVVKCYPFLEGEIHSFVADMIDQQRYTNRLITLYDWVIRASAKGVLLLPEGAVDPANVADVANQWSRFNGVIVYKARPENPEPKQVSGNIANLGISELLEIQLKMMEDVSGVNGILQGNISGGNVSGTLYNSQTANALYSLSDLLETFNNFIHDCAVKDARMLSQTS